MLRVDLEDALARRHRLVALHALHQPLHVALIACSSATRQTALSFSRFVKPGVVDVGELLLEIVEQRLNTASSARR